MPFSSILNQERNITLLQAALTNKRIPNAYLFYGEYGVGKEMTALTFARALLCSNLTDDACETCQSCHKISQFNHPDVHLIFPLPSASGKSAINQLEKDVSDFWIKKAQNPHINFYTKKNASISIGRIRELQKQIQYHPFEAEYKIYILTDIDKMTIPASNAFLKTLEEPPPHTIFILTTNRLHFLLPTIISRCQLLRFNTLSIMDIEQILMNTLNLSIDDANIHSRLAAGSVGRALENAIDNQLIEKRDMAIDIHNASHSASILKIFNIADDLAKLRDRNYLQEILNQLLVWYRDILIVKISNDISQIYNGGKQEDIKVLADKCTTQGLFLILEAIADAQAAIGSNVHSALTLTVLMIRMARGLRKK